MQRLEHEKEIAELRRHRCYAYSPVTSGCGKLTLFSARLGLSSWRASSSNNAVLFRRKKRSPHHTLPCVV
jgi:hypothetical protein